MRKQVFKGALEVAFIGSGYDSQLLTYKTTHLGNSLNTLKALIKGTHWYCSKLRQAKNPIIIYGSSVISSSESLSYIKMLRELSRHLSCTYNMLHSNVTTPGQMMLGLSSHSPKCKKSRFVWSINESELDDNYDKDNQFIVYQGNHGNSIAEKASVILPTCAYTEKRSHYVNTEGRMQQTAKAVNAPGLARLDSQIIIAFYAYCVVNNGDGYGKNKSVLNYLCSDYTDIKNIIKWVPNVHNFNSNLSVPKNYLYFDNTYYPRLKQPLTNNIVDFYQTDNISRNSSIMADCSSMLVTYNNFV